MEESLVLAAALFMVAGIVFLLVSSNTLSQFLAMRGWDPGERTVHLCRFIGLLLLFFGLYLLHGSNVWPGALPPDPGRPP